MTKLNSNYEVKLKILSPVHIGSGSEKDWHRGVDFIEIGDELLILDTASLYKQMNESLQEAYMSALGTGNIFKVEKLLQDNGLDLYASVKFIFPLDDGKLPNEIKTVSRTGVGMPFIPGSSLNGAIASTIFNYIHKHDSPKNHTKYINNDLLGSFSQSIMRFIRPSDVAMPNATGVSTVGLFNLYDEGTHWESDYKDKFSIGLEYFKPQEEANFRLSIADGFGNYVNQIQGVQALLPKYYNQIIRDFPISHLFSIINESTKIHINKEIAFFEKYNQAVDTDLIINELKSYFALADKSPDICVLRMGGHSGFHSITGDWRFKNHLETIGQPDRENLTWNQTERRKTPARYKSRKVMENVDPLLLGFVQLSI